MPFVRRKGGQVLVVHSARREGRVRQEVLARFASPEALSTVLHAWGAWTDAMQWRHEGLSWDFEALRERAARRRARGLGGEVPRRCDPAAPQARPHYPRLAR